jgi:hypothetical protein
MKHSLSPLYLSSGQSSSAPSRLDNPLAAFLGSLVLVIVVAVHFYALGAKADPALLAYDESASWQRVATSPATLATASAVLFSDQDFSALQSTASSGTILTTSFNHPPASNRGFGMSTSPSDSFGLEATLLVLNFGP